MAEIYCGVWIIMPYKDYEEKKRNAREYYQKLKEKLKADPEFAKEYRLHTNALARKNYIKNREKALERNRKYRKEHKEQIKESQRKWYTERGGKEIREKYKKESDFHKYHQKEWKRKYNKKRYDTDIEYKLAHVLRVRISDAIKTEQKTGSAVNDLGCTGEELKIHLENQFQEGMTWDNWKPDGWHIDHIKPLDKFDLTDPVQFKEAVHYTNLQPLWWNENLEKSDKWVDEG